MLIVSSVSPIFKTVLKRCLIEVMKNLLKERGSAILWYVWEVVCQWMIWSSRLDIQMVSFILAKVCSKLDKGFKRCFVVLMIEKECMIFNVVFYLESKKVKKSM